MRFINIAVLKSLTHFLKRLTPLLKHLTLCISFVFLRTSLCPFSATTLCTSLLISPQSHWGTVSKYSFIVPNHSGTPRLFIVHLGDRRVFFPFPSGHSGSSGMSVRSYPKEYRTHTEGISPLFLYKYLLNPK